LISFDLTCMAFQKKAVCLFYVYLLLSIDPISAARIKSRGKQVSAKLQESQELAQELQKAFNNDHMEELFVQNASSLYIGETWATCAGRKVDFERRSEKLKNMYEEAEKDGSLSTIEAGWIILKTRKVAVTMSTAVKQGCEWAQNQDVDVSNLQDLAKVTRKNVPCHDKARESLESVKGEPTENDVITSLSILFSQNCTAHDIEENSDTADEESEEKKAEDMSLAFENKMIPKVNSGLASLLQRVEDQASMIVVVPTTVSLVLSFVLGVILCTISLAIAAIILGLVFCLVQTILGSLLKIIGINAVESNFENCGNRWVGYLSHDRGLKTIGVGLCLLSTILFGFPGVAAPSVFIKGFNAPTNAHLANTNMPQVALRSVFESGRRRDIMWLKRH